MTDLNLLVPELILAVMALALILAARRFERARAAAAPVVVAAIAALGASWIYSSTGPETGFSGTLAGDGYARFFEVLFAATLALAALLSVKLVDRERVRPGEFYALLLLATTGMMLAASAMDLLVLYLGLELMTLCSYVLVGITREKEASVEAAMKYFLLGSFASALLLYGIGLTYGVTGATGFASIASAVTERGLSENPVLLAGVVLVFVGLAFKIAAVPFHAWAPDAYQGATAPVGAFLAAGSKAAGLAALVRVSVVGFPQEQPVWSDVLVVLAALSIAVGSLLALSQTNVKRLLAYSSISHAGYALLGLIPGTPEGAAATMTYAFVYAFMTIGAFGIVVALEERGESLEGYHGLARTSPLTAAAMFLFLLSLTGIPPTAGFTAKFSVILSVVGAGHIGLAVLAVVCSVISAFFYLRVAVFMYMSDPKGAPPGRFPRVVSAALAVAAVVTIMVGVFPSALAGWTIPP
ncbi:MAG TPA: NADH-quinone oxidoreductase subunit N [Vicinamibacteria bacterium]